MVISYVTTDLPDESEKVHDPRSPHRTQVLAIDISLTCFNAVAPEDKPTYVEFPPEVGALPGTCALLTRRMYGNRRAADGWQSECSGTLPGMGLAQGAASSCRQLICSYHGDDFTVSRPC